jgi:hypothetical protein
LVHSIGLQARYASRFHDDHAEPFARGVLQPAGARLELLVHEVVLDLAELPEVGRVDHLLEDRVPIVKRESQVADAPGGQRLLSPAQHVVLA